MANISKKFIEDRNQIEALHNEWCVENGYPVRWTRLQAGRPKLQATSNKLNEEAKAIKKYIKQNGAI